MYHHPPEESQLITSKFFKTKDGKQGLNATYFKDAGRTVLSKKQVDPNIDILWYTGRPDYVTDSTYAIRWEGKLIPSENGMHQFHLLCYDAKRIILNGDTLKMVYTSVEQYTEKIELEASKAYDFILETENRSTGAARMILRWKTPAIFAKEQSEVKNTKSRSVYLPDRTAWVNFWTGEKYKGGKVINTDAPIDIIPLFIKAGSIIPMGPFLQYSTEKPADPIELRIYPGADGRFTLYEDENDNYNYEKGIYSTINFEWINSEQKLVIGKRQGDFPGMLKHKTFNVVLVSKDRGNGLEISSQIDESIHYDGKKININF